MKVLFIASWYPSEANPLKGVFVKKHAQAIKRAGVDIAVLALVVNPSKRFYEKRIYSFVDEAGVKTHIIELNSLFYKFLYLDLFLQYGILKKYFKKNIRPGFNPDLVHSNVLFPAGILGYRLSRREKLPHVITEHWSKVPKFMKKSLWSGLGRKAYNNAECITTVSSFLKKRIELFVNRTRKIVVVPNVINSDQFSYRKKNADPTTISFTCVAHWTFPKRPDLIFHALEDVSKKVQKKIRLNVVGEGHLINELKNQNWNFEIIYNGNVPAPQLSSLLQASDYFLHASDIETFSVVIAEALSTGTPVLASNAGAIPELINSENGIICSNTIEEWKNGLRKLIQKTDWNHEKIAEATKRFNTEEVGEKMKDLYKVILP